MKLGEATRPDDIAVRSGKRGRGIWDPTFWVSEFFYRVINEGRTQSDWKESRTVRRMLKLSRYSVVISEDFDLTSGFVT